jgi:hypothetical protein
MVDPPLHKPPDTPPGESSTANLSGLSASYSYYPDDNTNGSVSITYSTGAPGQPTGLTGVAGDTTTALSWTAPTITGDTPISNYVVQYAPASAPTDWSTFSSTVTATSTTVTGLTDGTAYVFQVAAVNTTGTGGYSSPSAPVTPVGPPSAPTITAVNPDDGALSVSFSAPGSGAPFSGYDYQLNGSGTWIPSGSVTSPLVIAGLTDGATYSVQLRADNAIGSGTASAAVNGTPTAVPGAPTITQVSTGVATASVSFSPGFTGGGTITGYQYQLNGGSWVSASATTSPVAITGLSNGATYAIVLRAVNATGPGTASVATSVTTPAAPGVPTLASIVPGDRTASLVFTPGSTGGSTITSYQYSTNNGSTWTTATTLTSPVAVTGLTDGTAYPVELRAVNAVGAGPASASQSVTPATVPSAPTLTSTTDTGASSQLSVSFTAGSDGGSTIAFYQYSTDGGTTWYDLGSSTSPATIDTLSSDGTTPLADGIAYPVELRAVNAVGAGQASATDDGTPATTPAAPTITGRGQAAVATTPA